MKPKLLVGIAAEFRVVIKNSEQCFFDKSLKDNL